MSDLQSNAYEVIERLLAAYGVTTQRALAESLNVPSNNVSAWSQRNSVPGSAIIKCALDTGADLRWLVKGELAKANFDRSKNLPHGKALLDEIISNGGKAVLRRIMDAYGFTLQKQLCELLDISSGTVSTWIRRNHFPGEVVVTCALETGVSLEWLATGKGMSNGSDMENFSQKKQLCKIEKNKLSAGKLIKDGFYYFDNSFISKDVISPVFIMSASKSWLVDFDKRNISNGRWVIDIDGNVDVYDIARIPGNKINIVGNGSAFECNVEDVAPLGVVVLTLENNI